MKTASSRVFWTSLIRFAALFACLTEARAAPTWVDGSALLRQRFGEFVGGAPPASAPPALGAPARFEVGSQRNFFAVDFTTYRQYTVSATLRAVGDLCYVYVADDQWNARVADDDANELLDSFEHRTPADNRRGIYDIETEAFGNPPDVDGDPRIVLLLLDIRDGYRPGGAFVAGYFTDVNELNGVVRDRRWGIQFQSNQTEMVYLDTNPAFSDVAFTSSILAHEFQHLIHYGLDPNEQLWVNEGCSEFAMFLCGYPLTEHVHSFESEPSVSLTNWSSGIASTLPYYGSAYLWMLYLYERYGGLATIGSLAQNRSVGVDGVDATLRGRGVASGFREVFLNWRTALIADDDSYDDGHYGFENADVILDRTRHRGFPVSATTRSLSDWASDALSFESNFTDSLPLQVDVGGSGANRKALYVRALFFSGERLAGTRDLTANAATGRFSDTLTGFGDLYDDIVLVVAYAPESGYSGEIAYDYAARLGALVTFLVKAFRNPIQRDYIEIVAVPDAPVETGELVVRLKRGDSMLATTMRSVNGGDTFAATFRALDAAGDWSWELQHFGQSVGKGVFSLSP